MFIIGFCFILKNKNSKVKVKSLKNVKNRGFSSNVNGAVKSADGEILVLLNSDVSPHKNFLNPLIKNFSDYNVFAVACLDESIEGGRVVLRGRGTGKWRRGLFIHKRGEVDKRNTLWV
ncbi:MAG: glycosyltransferase family 2 protein, partial [Cytophagaceae bacterium]